MAAAAAVAVEAAEVEGMAAVVEDMAAGAGATRTKGTTTETTTSTATATATATPLLPGPARRLRRLQRLRLRRRPPTTPPSTRSIMAPIRMLPMAATKPTSRCTSNGRLPKPAMEGLPRALRVPQGRRRPRPRARLHRLLRLLPRRPRRRLRPGRRAREDTARYVWLPRELRVVLLTLFRCLRRLGSELPSQFIVRHQTLSLCCRQTGPSSGRWTRHSDSSLCQRRRGLLRRPSTPNLNGRERQKKTGLPRAL